VAKAHTIVFYGYLIFEEMSKEKEM